MRLFLCQYSNKVDLLWGGFLDDPLVDPLLPAYGFVLKKFLPEGGGKEQGDIIYS